MARKITRSIVSTLLGEQVEPHPQWCLFLTSDSDYSKMFLMVTTRVAVTPPGHILALGVVMPVTYLSDPEPFQHKENLYLAAREKECRVYDDELVRLLPKLPSARSKFWSKPGQVRPESLHEIEWEKRARSAARFRAYLRRQPKPLRILDLGCGNGWLAHQLAQLDGVTVCALDVNRSELEQGARVFGQQAGLEFCFGEIFEVQFEQPFDLVLLACSAQYFQSFPALIWRLSEILTATGEIHILDSPFYEPSALIEASRRSRDYYQELGVPEMALYYFHHSREALAMFSPRYHYRPDQLLPRIERRVLQRNLSPFPWVSLPHPEK